MIFGLNETSLGSSVAMAKGYDCSIGTALALIDSARNDYAMFESMLNVDATELQLRQEGYVNESSEIIALQESTISNIWKKICETLKKLAAKIKAIFHTFFSKINKLFLSDKQMVKKYEKEVLRKTNLDKMEVKVRNPKKEIDTEISKEIPTGAIESATKLAKAWSTSDDKSDREDKMYGELDVKWAIGTDNITEEYLDEMFDDESVDELKDTYYSNIRKVMGILNTNMPKLIKKMETNSAKMIREIGKEADKANKEANRFAKEKTIAVAGGNIENYNTGEAKEGDFNTKMSELNHIYEYINIFQDCQTKLNAAKIEAAKLHYKQAKAIFMKAIAANDKKLEESAVWADAIFEATEDEVDDIFDNAADNDLIGMGNINAASRNVLDADVSDDPDKLTYEPNKYTDDARFSVAGSIDSDITSRKESAYFGSMLY